MLEKAPSPSIPCNFRVPLKCPDSWNQQLPRDVFLKHPPGRRADLAEDFVSILVHLRRAAAFPKCAKGHLMTDSLSYLSLLDAAILRLQPATAGWVLLNGGGPSLARQVAWHGHPPPAPQIMDPAAWEARCPNRHLHTSGQEPNRSPLRYTSPGSLPFSHSVGEGSRTAGMGITLEPLSFPLNVHFVPIRVREQEISIPRSNMGLFIHLSSPNYVVKPSVEEGFASQIDIDSLLLKGGKDLPFLPGISTGYHLVRCLMARVLCLRDHARSRSVR